MLMFCFLRCRKCSKTSVSPLVIYPFTVLLQIFQIPESTSLEAYFAYLFLISLPFTNPDDLCSKLSHLLWKLLITSAVGTPSDSGTDDSFGGDLKHSSEILNPLCA